MSEWFANAGEEPGFKQGVISEVLRELPPKLTQREGTLQGRQAAYIALSDKVHGDDLRTFPLLFNGEQVASREGRWLCLQTATAELEVAFEAFGRNRDRDDFQRLWVNFLAPNSPQRLLASQHASSRSADTHPGILAAVPPVTGLADGAIPTLLLSTNGTSMADRLDLYGAFGSYLREQQRAYVALLKPEDLVAGVGSCFGSALAQFSGLENSAAEDVMGLVAWYEQETGSDLQPVPGAATLQPKGAAAAGSEGAAAPAINPAKGPAKTPGRGGARTPGGGRGSRGKGRTPLAHCAAAADAETDASGDGGPGTVGARLRARRGHQDQATAAAAEAEARSVQEAGAAIRARNRQRHLILLVEAAERVADRGALRALLAALYGERHRLPVVLVMGLSSPAAVYASKLPADVASLLQLAAAELAPYPLQLHRLFQDVLLTSLAPPPLLLDGATMRELLVQSRLLEPSLACLQTALLEANEQHFRREPLAPLALLPLQQHTADEAAAAAAARKQRPLPGRKVRCGSGSGDDEGDKSSGDEQHGRRDGLRASYATAKEEHDDGDGGFDTTNLDGGLEGLAALDDAWLEQRRRQHGARLAAAVSELPRELLRTAYTPLSAGSKESNDGGLCGGLAGGGSGEPARQDALVEAAVCEAVTEAFSALSAWRLGLRWLAILAERTGAIQLAGGHRYSLPSLYVAAASPRFWKPAAVSAAVVASCSAAAGSQTPNKKGTTTAAVRDTAAASTAAAASLGESFLAGVLGSTTGAAPAGGAGNGRGTLRALPEEELDVLLDDLMDAAREALRYDWLPAAAVLRATKGLAGLRLGCVRSLATVGGDGGEDSLAVQPRGQPPGGDCKGWGFPAAAAAPGKGGGGADEGDEMSPLRRRLAAQGLTSPSSAEKLKGVVDRLGRMDPLPAPKCLQPSNAPPRPPPLPLRPSQPSRRPSTAAGTTTHSQAASSSSIKLPTSGQTQSKRQRDQALLAAVQQRAAAAGPAAAAAAEASGQGAAASPAQSLADLAAGFLAAVLRDLLAVCPFHLPGSGAFTFRDAAGLQRRLVGAPSLALHTALTQPELVLKDLPPGLHPGQEDAAIAYQLLAGCKEGTDLRDWLADFCAASGLGRMQEVQQDAAEEEGEEDVDVQEDGPMGRSRTSRRRHAPRKRKAPPKQEMVLALDGPQADAAVDALACRFEQVARELEAVGLCRFSKRRKGLYVHRTYFPPEAVA